MKKIKKNIVWIIIAIFYLVFIAGSFYFDFPQGKEIGNNFYTFTKNLIKVIPCAFILIGLFEVWVKKETIERHLGQNSGFKSYFWGILLASTSIGGILIAFPISYALFNKGARLSVVFTYLGASAICRVPMTIFEASFLGVKFSLIRLFVSLPLIIVTSILLEKYLLKQNYEIKKGHI